MDLGLVKAEIIDIASSRLISGFDEFFDKLLRGRFNIAWNVAAISAGCFSGKDTNDD